ncbi:TetR/AcrR family transcriptional regulator [Candidatus Uabimicrobium sp. HlEnr_7]|uniref:TetR/AcrR family transcriptional regulator n=1 Tax=Candidatus Uabimicrobium helgolandensis TaxID=3095367 RepID=UPI0035590BBF
MAINKLEKRLIIFEKTLELISENGFHGTPVSKIADAANLSVGTIYRYFKNKDELIRELYNHIKQKKYQALMTNDTQEKPIRERFFNFWFNLTNYYLSNPKEFLFIEQYIYSPYSQNNDEKNIQLEKFFQYAQQQQVLKLIPIDVMISFIQGSISSLVKRHVSGIAHADSNAKQCAVNCCWDAIKL